MEISNQIDELKLYMGDDYKINNDFSIHQPSLREIAEFGEQEYYTMITLLCSVGADLKWQLDDVGIDYTKISDFELFACVLKKCLPTASTKILFGDTIDFSKMQYVFNNEIQDSVLIQVLENGKIIQVDRFVYSSIVNIVRKIHRLKRNDEIPGNEATKQILIEDARDEYEENKDKPYKPYLLPLVSTMVNSNGFKRNDNTVFDMKIYSFMDSVARIGKIKNADLLLQSGYSGFGIDLKKYRDETDWLGELD